MGGKIDCERPLLAEAGPENWSFAVVRVAAFEKIGHDA